MSKSFLFMIFMNFPRNKQFNNATASLLADALSNLIKLEEFELYM